MFVYSFCPLSDLSIFVQHPPLQLFLLRSRPAVRVRVLQAVANGSVLYHRPDRRYTLGTYNRTVLWACSHVKPQPNDLRGLMVAPAVGPPSNRSSDKLPLMKPLHFSAIISRALSTHAITRVISAAISSPSDVLTSILRFVNHLPDSFFRRGISIGCTATTGQTLAAFLARVPFPVLGAHSSAVSIVDHQGGEEEVVRRRAN